MNHSASAASGRRRSGGRGIDVIRLVRQFVADDAGQDLIEYGLLTGIVSVSAILMYTAVTPAMAEHYAGVLDDYDSTWLWEPPDPVGP